MKADDIIQKLEDLNRFILDAEADTHDGKIVDVKRLEREVALLCDKMLLLPPDDARNVQPVMAEMIGNLDRLEHGLQDLKQRLKEKR